MSAPVLRFTLTSMSKQDHIHEDVNRDWFAFGKDFFGLSYDSKIILENNGYEPCDTVACPARFAGWAPDNGDESLEVAETYDEILHQMYRNEDVDRLDGDNIVSAEDAKEAWLAAVAHLAHEESRAYPAVKAGVQIAREIGWLDDDEEVLPEPFDWDYYE